MNADFIATAVDHPVARALGWALVQFVWQGALIGVLAGAAFAFLRRAGGSLRYLAGCTALVMMVLAPVVTTIVVMPSFDAQSPVNAGVGRAIAGPALAAASERDEARPAGSIRSTRADSSTSLSA